MHRDVFVNAGNNCVLIFVFMRNCLVEDFGMLSLLCNMTHSLDRMKMLVR